MLAFFWGGGTGSEVLSTQEMRSKHPPNFPPAAGREGRFQLWQNSGPRVGEHKGQPRVGTREGSTLSTIWQRRGSLCLDTKELTGLRGPHTWEAERTEPLSQAVKASTLAVFSLGLLPASSRAQPHSSARASAHSLAHSCEYTPSWGRPCEYSLLKYLRFP